MQEHTWKHIIIATIQRLCEERDIKPTSLSVAAGLPRNYLHNLFHKDKRRIDIDELDALARYLGFATVLEFLTVAHDCA